MSERYIVMGVSGSGKSLIGGLFADRIGAGFLDGDSLHPEANIAKMQRGDPLDDTDRAPWLDQIGRALGASPTPIVIACSALKRSYRDRIIATANGHVRFLFLNGDKALLRSRMATRSKHFMPPALLDSQLSTLEPPTQDEDAVMVDIGLPPAILVDQLAQWARSRTTGPIPRPPFAD